MDAFHTNCGRVGWPVAPFPGSDRVTLGGIGGGAEAVMKDQTKDPALNPDP